MNKNAIRNYAIWARRDLINRVSGKAEQFGITEKSSAPADAVSIGGVVLTPAQQKQRKALLERISRHGYQNVMEEVAYTWFNRFIALRYMEVNDYLPTHVRVFTDESNAFKPQILAEALTLDLDGLNKGLVFELKDQNKSEELYKYLLITQCNALSAVLPGMFQRIEDYTELLFPDNLLRNGSVLQQMIELIPEADWQDQVQIIGWLYQYYNAEPKDKVFENLKKNIKISKENIPAATQLFTPDWIVRYMVENSLGRLWVEGHPNEELKSNWKYYLEEAEQEPAVAAQLAEIRKGYAALRPEDIKCIDPCAGSGHILVYLFDVLVQLYEQSGYSARDAAAMIVRNNLYGLDIDDRAAQLAYFAVMMKARQYDRRFLQRDIQPNVMAICESNGVDGMTIDYFAGDDKKLQQDIQTIVRRLMDAKEYGSILEMPMVNFDALYARFDQIIDDVSMFREPALQTLLPLVKVAEMLAQKYDVVVTNPPYMGNSGMGAKLLNHVKTCYPDSKSDLFAVFIERCGEMAKQNGFQAMITQHAWMFLSSYEKLRGKLMQVDTVNMAHLGPRAFEEIGGEVVQTTSFVLRQSHVKAYKGTYCRLIEPTTQQGKEDLFLAGEKRYAAQQDNFAKIPGSPVAYWVSETIFDAYVKMLLMNQFGDLKHGMTTGKNDVCLKMWYEVIRSLLIVDAESQEQFADSGCVYVPYNKGGAYQKWYGNLDYVLGYSEKYNEYMDSLTGHRHDNPSYYYRRAITWSLTNSSYFGARIRPAGSIFDVNGMSMFVTDDCLFNYLLGLMCSKVSSEFMKVNNPTLASQVGDVARIPVAVAESHVGAVDQLVTECVEKTRTDWDSLETSWDFKKHPLI